MFKRRHPHFGLTHQGQGWTDRSCQQEMHRNPRKGARSSPAGSWAVGLTHATCGRAPDAARREWGGWCLKGARPCCREGFPCTRLKAGRMLDPLVCRRVLCKAFGAGPSFPSSSGSSCSFRMGRGVGGFPLPMAWGSPGCREPGVALSPGDEWVVCTRAEGLGTSRGSVPAPGAEVGNGPSSAARHSRLVTVPGKEAAESKWPGGALSPAVSQPPAPVLRCQSALCQLPPCESAKSKHG